MDDFRIYSKGRSGTPNSRVHFTRRGREEGMEGGIPLDAHSCVNGGGWSDFAKMLRK